MKRILKRFIFLFFLLCFFLTTGYAQPDEYSSTISQALDLMESPSEQFSAQDDIQGEGELKPLQIDEEPQDFVEDPLMLDVLELKDMDIVDVLKLIAKKSGLNIVAGKNVRGKVSIYLKNVDVRDALRIILESNDLAYIEEDGIIKVMLDKEHEARYGHKFGQETQTRIIQLENAKAEALTPILNQMKTVNGVVVSDNISNTIIITDRIDKIILMESFIAKADIPLVTEVFILHYSTAEDIAQKLENLITKNIGKLEWDERSNRLFVTDAKEKMKKIKEMVAAFDVKQKEVIIEARIIQIVLSDQFKFGVDWQAIVRGYHDLTFISNFDVLSSINKGGKLSVGTLASDDYEVLIEALQTVGDTNTLSNPRITVMHNQEAKILVGSNTPYVTQETITTAAGPVTTSESVNFIDTGVKLFVTPLIHEDGYITMKIRPEVSSVTDYLTTSTNNEIPIVETSQAETTVMAKDGVTIVIGGLMKDEKIETIKKIPLLGDIPFLGIAFRSISTTARKTELVIFLTPHIVTGDVSVDEDEEMRINKD